MSSHYSASNDPLITRILRALEGLEYGSVQIVVYDSQVIQIDRTEKHRLLLEKTEKNQNRSSQSKHG